MRELSQEECIVIRKRILYEFHKMCVANKINYSIGYGTLLGAVRHKGMIPWDDDIDVVVSRLDFERLNDIYNTDKCMEKYQFVSHNNHPEIKTKIGYFIDFSTITEVASRALDYHGIHIDIYPYDVVPNGCLKRKVLFVKRWFWHKVIRAKDLHPEVVNGFGKFLRYFVLFLVSPFDYDKALNHLQAVSQKYSGLPDADRIEACVFVEEGAPLVFPYRVTQSFSLYEFDGNMYYGYKDFDTMLKVWYGDYMTPPDIDNQRMPDHKYVHFYAKD